MLGFFWKYRNILDNNQFIYICICLIQHPQPHETKNSCNNPLDSTFC